MFHVLDLIRVNIYITYNSLVEEEDRLDQKGFVMSMVNTILENLTTLRYSSNIYVQEKTSEINEQDPIHKKRSRANHNPPICLLIYLRDQQLTTS